MATQSMARRPAAAGTRRAAAHAVLRVAGVASLIGTAWIHEHLYRLGYASVPTIGPLFRLDAVLALAAAVVVLLAPGPWFRLACAGGALLQLGTLAALAASLTVGTFGFTETLDAPLVPQTVGVEGAGAVILLIGALLPRARAGGRHHRGRGDGGR